MRSLAGLVGLLLVSAAVSGCASSRVSTTTRAQIDHPVRAVAMAPSGGLLADAVALALFERGFNVYDTAQSSALLVRLDMTEVEVTEPQSLTALREQGIDAYLTVRAAAGHDGAPESAVVRLTSTHTGQVVAGLSWQNGRGGMAGSPADRMMRAGLAQAADQIATAVAGVLPAP